MAPSIFGRFLGNTVSGAAGMAIGGAVRPTLDPLTQEVANETWPLFAIVPPDPYYLAAGVAQGQVGKKAAYDWAAETGYGKDQMDALVAVANTGPALGYAYSAWRRGKLTDPEFKTALKRQAIEDDWIDALMALKQEPLDPSTIANAVHRGIMRDPSLIVREPPTTAGRVEQVPPSPIDPAEEAAWSGIDHERLRVEVGTTGLPPGLIQMLQLLNRGEVTIADVQRSVSQSNLRNEYMDVVLALRRQLLTPHEYEEAALRGIMSQNEADAGAALSGMEKADARLLFEIMGRPLVVHQITTGLARGGQFGGTYADVPEPYRDAIRRSNIRPEYARLAYANRYTLPSAFVLRSLVQSGDLTEAQGHELLLGLGWPPDLAATVSAKWAGGTTATTSAPVKSEQSRLRTATHRSYVARESDDAAATAALEAAGVPTGDIAAILAIWQAERGLIRAQLSPSDVRKAYRKGTTNAATGNKWTRDEALAALIDRGWGVVNANDYLDI